MDKNDLIRQLKEDVYCRLGPSEHGIGVFAIKDIPKETNPFRGCDDTDYDIQVRSEELFEVDPSVIEYFKDVFVMSNLVFWVSQRGLQGIDISYYLNHSDVPNMKADPLGEIFRANRDIKKGEELTVDYTTYDDQNDDFTKKG